MFEHSGDTFYVSDGISFSDLRFENDVEMYGAQAIKQKDYIDDEFENDVEMYGAQAQVLHLIFYHHAPNQRILISLFLCQ